MLVLERHAPLKNTQVFTIEPNHIQEFGGKIVKIEIKMNLEHGKKKFTCLFGDTAHTATCRTIPPLSSSLREILGTLKTSQGEPLLSKVYLH